MKQVIRKSTIFGDIFFYEYLELFDLKINELVELLYVYRNSVSVLINNNRKFIIEMVFCLVKVFDIIVDFWLNFQVVVDFWEVENNMCIQEELGWIEIVVEYLVCREECVKKVV